MSTLPLPGRGWRGGSAPGHTDLSLHLTVLNRVPVSPVVHEQGELTFNQTTEIMNKTNRTEQKTESQNKKRRSDSLSKPALGARPGLRPHLQGSQALLSPPRTRRLPDRQAPSHPPASASRRHLLETPCPPAACFSAGLPTPGSVC